MRAGVPHGSCGRVWNLHPETTCNHRNLNSFLLTSSADCCSQLSAATYYKSAYKRTAIAQARQNTRHEVADIFFLTTMACLLFHCMSYCIHCPEAHLLLARFITDFSINVNKYLFICYYLLRCYTTVRYGLQGRGSIPGRGKKCFSSPQRPDRYWVPRSFLFNVYRGQLFRG
jgi:hypothetical protein